MSDEREIEGDEVAGWLYGLPLEPCDMTDPAQVEAWFDKGAHSIGEHVRKCVQAQCEELLRAGLAVKGEKMSEGRIEALGRLHPHYLSYVKELLQGRTLRNRDVRATGFGA